MHTFFDTGAGRKKQLELRSYQSGDRINNACFDTAWFDNCEAATEATIVNAFPNYRRFTEVLLTWRELHREVVANVALRSPSWDSAHLLVRSADSLDHYARQHLEDALAQSDAELSPLRDPLALNLGAHRWLSADREESYSDWLAWILQGMSGSAEILPLFALGDDATSGPLGPMEKVQREGLSEYGRTDIEVQFGSRGLLLIEVKTKPPSSDLFSQLKRYDQWAAGQRVERKLLVLLGACPRIPQDRGNDWNGIGT
jgi:hypothetical protein